MKKHPERQNNLDKMLIQIFRAHPEPLLKI